MADDLPVFDTSRCGLPALPSLRGRTLVTDCTAPPVPPPIRDCSATALDIPLLGIPEPEEALYAELVAEVAPGAYSWRRLFPDGAGGWRAGVLYDGRGTEPAYPHNGETGVPPGVKIRLVRGYALQGEKDWRFPAPRGPLSCGGHVLGLPVHYDRGFPVYTVYEVCEQAGRAHLNPVGTARPCEFDGGWGTSDAADEASESADAGERGDCPYDCASGGYALTGALGIPPMVGSILGRASVELCSKDSGGNLTPTGVFEDCYNAGGQVPAHRYISVTRDNCGHWKVEVVRCLTA